MSKTENIFNLYDKLGNSGQKGNAVGFIAETCSAKKATVKGHWLVNKEFPDYMLIEENEHKLDAIISYLQKQIAAENQLVK